MLPRNLRQEALSRAYVQAVAAQAGVICSKPDPDLGIDLSLRDVHQEGNQYQDSGLQLDLQLRSTTRASMRDGQVYYDLDVRTHEYLRRTAPMCPRLLVLLVLPEDEALWVSQSPDELLMRHCAYWLSLRGAAPAVTTSTVRVAVPCTQVFSAQAIRAILDRLAQGSEP